MKLYNTMSLWGYSRMIVTWRFHMKDVDNISIRQGQYND